MLDNLVCPISNVRIDRNVVRTNGFITTLLLVTYVFTRSVWIAVPVGLDYVLRASMKAPPSPMSRFAQVVAKALKFPDRAMDKAPKVFASRIGVCFAMGTATTHFVAPEAAPWLAGTLAVFTTLESVFDLCVGCVAYTYVALPLYKARDAVTAIPLFRALEDPMLEALAEGFAAVEFAAGSRILGEGEPGNELFMIRTGEVEVFHAAGAGPETIVATYKPGDVFGEMAIVTGQPRVASVRARTPVTALRLLKSDVDGLLAKHPGMREVLVRTAAERLAKEEASKAA